MVLTSETTTVVSIQNMVDLLPAGIVEHLFLLGIGPEYLIELERYFSIPLVRWIRIANRYFSHVIRFVDEVG
jgi:hypothetical protein